MDQTGTSPQSFDSSQEPFGFGHTINKMSSDMNFVGLFSIILGSLYIALLIIGAIILSLSLIGIVVAIPMLVIGLALTIPIIIAGIRLREASQGYRSYSDTQDSAALQHSFERQGKAFNIYKILAIIYIIIIGLYILAMIIAFSLGSDFARQLTEFNNLT